MLKITNYWDNSGFKRESLYQTGNNGINITAVSGKTILRKPVEFDCSVSSSGRVFPYKSNREAVVRNVAHTILFIPHKTLTALGNIFSFGSQTAHLAVDCLDELGRVSGLSRLQEKIQRRMSNNGSDKRISESSPSIPTSDDSMGLFSSAKLLFSSKKVLKISDPKAKDSESSKFLFSDRFQKIVRENLSFLVKDSVIACVGYFSVAEDGITGNLAQYLALSLGVCSIFYGIYNPQGYQEAYHCHFGPYLDPKKTVTDCEVNKMDRWTMCRRVMEGSWTLPRLLNLHYMGPRDGKTEKNHEKFEKVKSS